MTSRELVLRTLEFRNDTGRLPQHIWTLPIAKMTCGDAFDAIVQDFPDDFLVAEPKFAEVSPVTEGDMYALGTYIDDWGAIFMNHQAGYIGEVKEPLITDDDWEDWEKIHIPEEWLSFDPAEVDAICDSTDKFVFCNPCPRPFEQLQFLRGTENLMMDLMDPPELMLQFMEKMHDFYCRLLEKWAQTKVDGLRFMDDWGTQKSLLISPVLWQQYFRPMYQDYINIAKKYGKKIFMHSDGYTLSILPELIELGLDAINTQIFCMDFEDLKQFRGKLTFWGEIDRQYLLPFGTEEDCRAAVDKIMENLWDNGGVIAQLEFGLAAKAENVRAAMDQWKGYGK